MNKMSTMQKIVIWTLILIGFFILSDFLINVGLNSAYKNISREDKNEEIIVYQADATYVNGRIRGLIKKPKNPQDRYLKIDVYSKIDVIVGTGYIELKDLEEEESQPFELLFRAKEVAYYKVDTVKEKEAGTELEIIPKELTKQEIVLATLITILIFWG